MKNQLKQWSQLTFPKWLFIFLFSSLVCVNWADLTAQRLETMEFNEYPIDLTNTVVGLSKEVATEDSLYQLPDNTTDYPAAGKIMEESAGSVSPSGGLGWGSFSKIVP